MPSYYFGPDIRVRTSRPSRKYEFVRSKSFSYGHRDHHDRHHHHHHHRLHVCPENCAGVTYDEWNVVLRENRTLFTRNENTGRENQTLKKDLQTTKDEVQRSRASNQQLSDENHQLRKSLLNDGGDNADKLRRRVESMTVEIGNKDYTIYRIEKENASLTAKIRDLTDYARDNTADKIADLSSEVAHWKQRAADTLDLVKRFENGYDRVLKDLDKQHGLIDQYRSKIRHLEGLVPHGSVRIVQS